MFTNDPAIWLKELLVSAGLSFNLSSILSTAGLVLIVLLLSWLSNVAARAVIRQIVTRIVERTTSTWDDIFLEQKVFTRLSHLAPALVIWSMAGWALRAYPGWLLAVQKLTYIYMVIVGMVVINSFIEAWHKIYLTLPISQHRHIKGYVQMVKLIIGLIALLVIVSVVFRKEVSTLIAGLGAMAAVLMLIFKDAILGLVASIQLSANKMLKVGDWITIPSKGVDGIVEDITLTTVKVQNFDKTIVTVPVYSLVNESFQNWKGMEESGIRQIKRSLLIDIRTIYFADQKLVDRLGGIVANSENAGQNSIVPPGKNFQSGEKNGFFYDTNRVTNLGLFRVYAETFLREHKLIDDLQPIVVRHLAAEGNGLPIQVNAFCKNNAWVPYEHVQSEIFEHLIAILREFDLKIFQNPAGDDMAGLSGTK